MEFMNGAGTTVLLDTSLSKLHTRLMRGRHKRPLIAGKSDSELREFIVKALEERMPFYPKRSAGLCRISSTMRLRWRLPPCGLSISFIYLLSSNEIYE